MKKSLLLFVGIIAFGSLSFAQTNLSFESWSGTLPGFDPDNWSTINQFTPSLGVNGPFVYQDSNSTDGNFSARLVTKDCPNCIANSLPDPAPGHMSQETPFSWPLADSICILLDYIYNPAAISDTGSYLASFTHWDSILGNRVTDYFGDYTITSNATWQLAHVHVTAEMKVS